MNRSVAYVLKGFESLTDQEKEDFLIALSGAKENKGLLKEAVRKDMAVALGPYASGPCNYCGR